MSENEIKPVVVLCETVNGRYWSSNDALHLLPLGDYYDQSAIDRLTAELDKLRELAACAYQLAGVHDAPTAWLDALSDAASGAEFSSDGLLPYMPDAVCNAETQLAEYKMAADAEANQVDLLTAKIHRLVAERDAAVAHAERYLWLRRSRLGPQRAAFLDSETSDQLDAAIDAARSGGGV